MAGLVGYDQHKVETTSKAQFSNTKVEVVMALDITGSMGWNISGSSITKLQALKTASQSAIDTLFKDETSPRPHSPRPRALFGSRQCGTDHQFDRDDRGHRMDMHGCRGWNRQCSYGTTYPDCVRERTGTEAYTDAFAASSAKVGSSAYNCPSAEIVPMSTDTTMLKNQISGFSASGCTAGTHRDRLVLLHDVVEVEFRMAG